VRHIVLPDSFPHPTGADEAETLRLLLTVPEDQPLIVDGLAFGALDSGLVAQVRAPIVVMLHHPLGLEAGLPADRSQALIERERANLRHAAHIVVPSPHIARVLTARFGVAADDVSVALPGFIRPPVLRVPKDDPPLILSVGLLAARKGHDVLLDALARVADLDWRCKIVGLTREPTVARSLESQRARLGLEERVLFAGCIADDALQTLFAQASLFALATRYEGYGIAFGEALLNGLPIVTCATGAVPDTVPASAGILLPPDDPERFAAALRRLLTDPEERAARARAAREAGDALPGWAQTAAVMGAVLDRVAARQRA
jgi:glycosyltransferase involved in cell wall biosynthesis